MNVMLFITTIKCCKLLVATNHLEKVILFLSLKKNKKPALLIYVVPLWSIRLWEFSFNHTLKGRKSQWFTYV